jgi:hypothetical protein
MAFGVGTYSILKFQNYQREEKHTKLYDRDVAFYLRYFGSIPSFSTPEREREAGEVQVERHAHI